MSELYVEPEDHEVTLLRARLAIYSTENDALRHEIESLKEKAATLAARVRQLEFEATVGGRARFAQRSEDSGRMERIIPHDSAKGGVSGKKPGL